MSAKAGAPKPLDYIERFTGGASPTEALPLVVVLHGRGDVPENFTKRLEGFSAKARFAYLEAPIDEGKGRGWFTFDRMPGGWKRTSDKVKHLGERVMVTVDAIQQGHRTLGKPVLTGFSQGAMVVYATILAHPTRYHAALPVSGALFDSILPEDMPTRAPNLPPVVAFHGEDDPIIPARASKEAAAVLDSYGARAEVRTFPRVPHWIMGDLKSELLAELERCVAASVNETSDRRLQ